ncbi:hypothetical protein OMCYN_00692 [cyanobiont of Ornithocercus magnificus]|nr:hypothetical protein OMCYN_00692 [cyanobiont of Ornithocercus magnificus]
MSLASFLKVSGLIERAWSSKTVLRGTQAQVTGQTLLSSPLFSRLAFGKALLAPSANRFANHH